MWNRQYYSWLHCRQVTAPSVLRLTPTGKGTKNVTNGIRGVFSVLFLWRHANCTHTVYRLLDWLVPVISSCEETSQLGTADINAQQEVDGRKLKNFTRAIVDVCRRQVGGYYQRDAKKYSSHNKLPYCTRSRASQWWAVIAYWKVNYLRLPESCNLYSPARNGTLKTALWGWVHDFGVSDIRLTSLRQAARQYETAWRDSASKCDGGTEEWRNLCSEGAETVGCDPWSFVAVPTIAVASSAVSVDGSARTAWPRTLRQHVLSKRRKPLAHRHGVICQETWSEASATPLW